MKRGQGGTEQVSIFFRFPPAAGETYSDCTWSYGRRHCNKIGTQAPRTGMLFSPILQHCSKSIALLGDCSNSRRHSDDVAVSLTMTSPFPVCVWRVGGEWMGGGGGGGGGGGVDGGGGGVPHVGC